MNMTTEKEDETWPSRFGTLGEKVFGKDDPFNDPKYKLAKNFQITDEMEPTKSPINSKLYFTSKSKLRQHYRERGFEEVGTAYENGHNPEKYHQDKSQEVTKKIKEQMRERLYGR